MTSGLIADDQALVRGGFRMILEAQDDIKVVGEADDGRYAVEKTRLRKPDVVLMDVPHARHGRHRGDAQILSGRAHAATRVLMLTTVDLDEYVHEALEAGAAGSLLKNTAPPELVAAIGSVARGDALPAPSITRRLIEEYVHRPRAGAESRVAARLTGRSADVARIVSRYDATSRTVEDRGGRPGVARPPQPLRPTRPGRCGGRRDDAWPTRRAPRPGG